MARFNILNLCLIIIFYSFQCHADESLKLELSAKSSKGNCDEFVFVVNLINKAGKKIILPSVMVPGNYLLNFEFISADGEAVHYSGMEYKLAGLNQTIILNPGYIYGREIRISSEQYNICNKKNYSVIATYGGKTFNEVKDIPLIKSNSIDIEIDVK